MKRAMWAIVGGCLVGCGLGAFMLRYVPDEFIFTVYELMGWLGFEDFGEWTEALVSTIVVSPVALVAAGTAVTIVSFGRRGASETRCRRCSYILRGLTEPRCPECGETI